MSDDWDDDDELLAADAAPRVPASGQPAAEALVVEADPDVARTCSRTLRRLGMSARVVWRPEDATEALSRRDARFAFVYADARLLGGSCAEAAGAIRRLRPDVPLVLGTREIGDVLSGEVVAISRPFASEHFQAAFDTSLCDEPVRRLLAEAAATEVREDAAWVAAMAASPSPPSFDPVPQSA